MAKTIIAESFLSQEEATHLKFYLAQEDIDSIIKQMPDDLTAPNYYLFINESDKVRAEPILRQFKIRSRKATDDSKKYCPNCKSTYSVIIQKRVSFWRKLLSIGTVSMKCLKCGTEWYN